MPDLLKKYDAIVIGSGASGAVMAYELATKGMKVLVLERGKRYSPNTDFAHNEMQMYAKLYKSCGLQTTKNNDITIAQGQTVGGSTVINNAIWLRANLDEVLPRWKNHGAHIPKDKIVENYTFLETQLKVKKMLPREANGGTEKFLAACDRLNIPADYLTHNRHECIGCGWCNYGCKYNRKTSMLVTFLPWAEAKGATIQDGVQNLAITHKNKIANGVSFMLGITPHLIAADKIIVCAGAIGSSEVLLKSGINPAGNVGKKFHALGGCFVNALMPDKINSFDGIGLSCIARASKDYLIETFFAPPGVFSISLGSWYEDHHQAMLKYPYMMQAGVMVATEPTGKIKLDKKNRVVIDLKLSAQNLKNLKRGIQTLTGIYLEAGAQEVMPSSFKKISITNHGDIHKIDEMIKRQDDITIGSAHPQGGNVMSDDPQKGVVSSQFKVHEYTNVFIADTSVWPSNIWANCQATTMAMAKYASTFVI